MTLFCPLFVRFHIMSRVLLLLLHLLLQWWFPRGFLNVPQAVGVPLVHKVSPASASAAWGSAAAWSSSTLMGSTSEMTSPQPNRLSSLNLVTGIFTEIAKILITSLVAIF